MFFLISDTQAHEEVSRNVITVSPVRTCSFHRAHHLPVHAPHILGSRPCRTPDLTRPEHSTAPQGGRPITLSVIRAPPCFRFGACPLLPPSISIPPSPTNSSTNPTRAGGARSRAPVELGRQVSSRVARRTGRAVRPSLDRMGVRGPREAHCCWAASSPASMRPPTVALGFGVFPRDDASSSSSYEYGVVVYRRSPTTCTGSSTVGWPMESGGVRGEGSESELKICIEVLSAVAITYFRRCSSRGHLVIPAPPITTTLVLRTVLDLPVTLTPGYDWSILEHSLILIWYIPIYYILKVH